MLGQRQATLAGMLWILALPMQVHGGEAAVLATEFKLSAHNTWQVSATLEHVDTGWAHYADAWRIVGENGEVFGTRILYHPHETEQPFTRSLSGVDIPSGVRIVFVQGRDKLHGWSDQRLRVDLGEAAQSGWIRVQR